MIERSVLIGAVVLAVGSAMACGDGAVPASSDDAAPSQYALPRPDTEDPTVLRGWSSVVRRDCARCHQSPSANDGILGGSAAAVAGTMAFAPNLTPDPDTGLDGWSAAAIAIAMREGIDDEGQALCPTMPRFADMADDEALAIAAYLQMLPAVHHLVSESICLPLKPRERDASDDADAGDDASEVPDDAAVLDSAADADG